MAIGITQHKQYQQAVQNQANKLRNANTAVSNAASALRDTTAQSGAASAIRGAQQNLQENSAARSNAFSDALRSYLQKDSVSPEFQNNYNVSVLQEAIRKLAEQRGGLQNLPGAVNGNGGLQNLPGNAQTVPAGQLNKLPGAGYTGGASTLPMRPNYNPGEMERLQGGIYNPPRKLYY